MSHFSFFISRRYLTAKKKTGFISVISYISIAGVAIGTAALIITFAVISGFELEMKNKYIGFDSHIRVRTYMDAGMDNVTEIDEKIRRMDHVIASSPYIEKEGMIRSRKVTDGVFVKGIDEDRVISVLNIGKELVRSKSGRVDVRKDGEDRLPGIVIGEKLSKKLKVDLGDRATVFSLSRGPAIIEQPRVKQFEVTGIYRSGMAQYDDIYVYVDLAETQNLFNMQGRVSGIEVRLDDVSLAEEISAEMEETLGYPYFPRSWFELHRNIFGWLKTNNLILTIIFSFIIIVAAFNIIGTLIMIVIEKKRDIGILKAMGASSREIVRIFVLEGLFIGVSGAAAGSLIAFGLTYLQAEFKIISLSSEVYFMDSVPILMDATHYLLISVFSVFLCVLATVYPARKAASLQPVDAIRFE